MVLLAKRMNKNWFWKKVFAKQISISIEYEDITIEADTYPCLFKTHIVYMRYSNIFSSWFTCKLITYELLALKSAAQFTLKALQSLMNYTLQRNIKRIPLLFASVVSKIVDSWRCLLTNIILQVKHLYSFIYSLIFP